MVLEIDFVQMLLAMYWYPEHISIHSLVEIVLIHVQQLVCSLELYRHKPWKQPIFEYEKNDLWPSSLGLG